MCLDIDEDIEKVRITNLIMSGPDGLNNRRMIVAAIARQVSKHIGFI